jgi:hypothetical protein
VPDFDAWQGTSFPLSTWRDDTDRGVDTARLIAEKSSSITITRAGSQLSAQTVRLEPLSGPSEGRSEAGIVSNTDVLVIGYKDHASITDTNIRRGDRFYYSGQLYTVTQVLPDVPKRVLAIGEASE